MKVEVTFASHRFHDCLLNIYPEKHWLEFVSLNEAVLRLQQEGFRLEGEHPRHVMPGAILEVKEYVKP